MPEDLCIGLEDEVLEMGWEIWDPRPGPRYDDVHAFFQMKSAILRPSSVVWAISSLDILGVLARIAEKFVPSSGKPACTDRRRAYRAVLSPGL
ncbi:MAG: hypothetical protein ACLTTU_07300 [Bilophila wadsworthia]